MIPTLNILDNHDIVRSDILGVILLFSVDLDTSTKNIRPLAPMKRRAVIWTALNPEDYTSGGLSTWHPE